MDSCTLWTPYSCSHGAPDGVPSLCAAKSELKAIPHEWSGSAVQIECPEVSWGRSPPSEETVATAVSAPRLLELMPEKMPEPAYWFSVNGEKFLIPTRLRVTLIDPTLRAVKQMKHVRLRMHPVWNLLIDAETGEPTPAARELLAQLRLMGDETWPTVSFATKLNDDI